MSSKRNWVGLMFSLVMGCSASSADDPAGASDQAVSTPTAVTYLGSASRAEISATASARLLRLFEECVASRVVVSLTTDHVDHFAAALLGAIDREDLTAALRGVFHASSATTMSLDKIRAELRVWPERALASPPADALLCAGVKVPTPFLRDCETASENNAFSRAKKPTGIDLPSVLTEWRAFRSMTREKEIYGPYRAERPLADREAMLAAIRSIHSFLSIAPAAEGARAIDGFVNADFAGAGKEFGPIRSQLAGPGVKSAFYFRQADRFDIDNFLWIVDDQSQLWGFRLGDSLD